MKSTLAILFAVVGGSFAAPTEYILVENLEDARVQRQPAEQSSASLDAINVQIFLNRGPAAASCHGIWLCLKDDDCPWGCRCNESARRCVIGGFSRVREAANLNDEGGATPFESRRARAKIPKSPKLAGKDFSL
ncbi:hypothetical protein CMUS01_14749 [Colletotrichum musicola]|uniref:Uncharacterized protein n=1 Tax=Colletotrichum musicola TaxID=2175873 RepID=A0A8H6J2B6_9PEZI|nr:hypothetical protein CMUS01_14749 [Colletotrichum musicola]